MEKPVIDQFFDFCCEKPLSIQEFVLGTILQQAVDAGEIEDSLLTVWYAEKGFVYTKNEEI